MRKLTKALTFGAAFVALGVAGAAAMAQHAGHGFGPGMMGHGMMRQHNGFDPTSHLASVKSELAITGQQNAAWDAYAKVVIDTATSMRASHEKVNPDTIHSMSNQDRANFMASHWDQRDKAQATVKAAAETLLTTLNDTQKIKAHYVLPGLSQRAEGPMMHGGMGGMGMMGGNH